MRLPHAYINGMCIEHCAAWRRSSACCNKSMRSKIALFPDHTASDRKLGGPGNETKIKHFSGPTIQAIKYSWRQAQHVTVCHLCVI